MHIANLPNMSVSLPLAISFLSATIAVLSLTIALKGYRRKAGVFVRGTFTMASSVDCDDMYVSSVILENIKDRAVTIFAIYLLVGHNNYVEVEQFEEQPLLLGPYQSYHKEFGPIEFYEMNLRRVKLDHLLGNRAVSRRLMLSTSDGRYKVRRHILRWNPVSIFFANHLTTIVHPVRSRFKHRDVGSNVSYVLELLGDEGDGQVILLRRDDYQVKIFRTFTFTEESLASKQQLADFLNEMASQGKLFSKAFRVHEMAEWRRLVHEDYSTSRVVQLEDFGWIRYRIIGRSLTALSDWKMRRTNKHQMDAARSRHQSEDSGPKVDRES